MYLGVYIMYPCLLVSPSLIMLVNITKNACDLYSMTHVLRRFLFLLYYLSKDVAVKLVHLVELGIALSLH